VTKKISSSNSQHHVESQRELFNKEFAHIDSSDLAEWQKSYLDRIEKYLFQGNKKKGKVLELGCGDGKLSISLAEKGYQVTAADISDVSMQLVKKFAKQKKVRVTALQCDVMKLPLKDNTFDFAVANSILEHLQDYRATVAEWTRVLKPGGRILVVTPLRQRHVAPWWWVLNWFHDRRLGHVRRYDRQRYEAFSEYGLELKKILYTGHTPKVLLTIANMVLKNKALEKWAEHSDTAWENIEFDGNNVIGFFQKKSIEKSERKRKVSQAAAVKKKSTNRSKTSSKAKSKKKLEITRTVQTKTRRKKTSRRVKKSS
jgi:ubiquinone/menaquinone biosynthesis C-methylase UbiE